MCTEKNFVLCTYFFAFISSLSIIPVILNRSSFRPVLIFSTGSFTVLSSVILRCFFVVSTVRLCLLFLVFFVPCFVQVVSSIRTLFFAIHVNCLYVQYYFIVKNSLLIFHGYYIFITLGQWQDCSGSILSVLKWFYKILNIKSFVYYRSCSFKISNFSSF